jgi:hypothetical protein
MFAEADKWVQYHTTTLERANALDVSAAFMAD